MAVSQDDMTNSWGCNLVNTMGAARRSRHQLDLAIRSSVPGWMLMAMKNSGTEANSFAIDKATGKDMDTLLCAYGGYVGGDDDLQPYSSSEYNNSKTFALPKFPVDASEKCKRQTIVLPYFVPRSNFMINEQRSDYQHQCLAQLHKRLLRCRLAGRPVKVLLLEYILGGNGGELDPEFLVALGILLEKFDVEVIADEVLTAGRVDKMTMTQTMPDQFRDRVSHITVAKFPGCGIVLQRALTKPSEHVEQLRGSSTNIEPGLACQMWDEVAARVKQKVPSLRRQQVIDAFKLDDSRHWGKGCLMFTDLTRSEVTRGLKIDCCQSWNCALSCGKRSANEASGTQRLSQNTFMRQGASGLSKWMMLTARLCQSFTRL